MRTRMRVIANRPFSLLLVLACVIVLVAPLGHGSLGHSGVASARARGWAFNSTENCFMRKINRIRGKHGMGRLNPDRQLGFVARKHSKSMASSGGIYHDGNLAQEITRWRSLGQNTGRGSSCKSLFWSFMKSSAHRTNIMGAYSFVGVGTERRGGNLYVQQVFESRRDPGNVYRYP